LIRDLHNSGLHIHLATGISGIAVRRLRSVPLAHEPLLYVEAPSLGATQLVVKRCFDIVLATIGLIVLSPLFVAVAIAIKLDDGAPILFKQSRVGRGGRTFAVLKFRSMMVDAESRLAELGAGNERQGPLFKMGNDPRVTRVGGFLRESSLDELPQLWNVLRGQMSLVGPRPALPSEVANFSSELRMREQVMPGITGLWQVEARDNPSFEAYRRLDLFYVENWSITLDLMILVGTVEQIVVRMVRSLARRQASDTQPLVLPELEVLPDQPAAISATSGQ
jgi:exopolysaccharide biosynthesis polyprenyl glycosylphosphotransferase